MPSLQTITATEDFCERLMVMKCQEIDYMVPDYLTPAWQAGLIAEVSDPLTLNGGEPSSASSSDPISALWRDKICQWCYNLVDHYELARESVAVAMNIVDRFVSSRFTTITSQTYTLVTVVAIHIAIKLVSPWKLRMDHLLDLCMGKYTAADIASMELTVLDALSWKVHPPTAAEFCSQLIDSSFTESTPHVLNDLHDKARYLTELAVCDYFFVTHKASSVALASIMCALELTDNHIDPRDKDRFTSNVAQIALDVSDEEVIQCYKTLRVMYRKNVLVDDEEAHDGEVGGSSGHESPVCVEELSAADTPPKKRKRVQQDKEGRLVSVHGEEIALFGPM